MLAQVQLSCDLFRFIYISQASALFMHTNGLSPLAFPSLRRLEVEIVSMAGVFLLETPSIDPHLFFFVAKLLNGDQNVCGSVSTGGTESIFLAMKTYRDRARVLSPGACYS